MPKSINAASNDIKHTTCMLGTLADSTTKDRGQSQVPVSLLPL